MTGTERAALVESLLEAEKRRPPPSARQRRSLWRRTRRSLAGAGLLSPLLAGQASASAATAAKVLVAVACLTTSGAFVWLRARPAPAVPSRPAAVVAPALVPPPVSAPPSPATLSIEPPPPRPTPGPRRALRPAVPQSESSFIDDARAALARRDPRAAEAALARHVRRFPRGTFAEEREALGVLCLAQRGRAEAARDAALRFRARYPDSLYLPVLPR